MAKDRLYLNFDKLRLAGLQICNLIPEIKNDFANMRIVAFAVFVFGVGSREIMSFREKPP